MMSDRNHTIPLNGDRWDFERPVLDSCQIEHSMIVIFDYMSYPRNKQSKNMIAFDLNQNELWTAAHPTNQTNDTYVKFIASDPLQALNFASFVCTLDPKTGQLLSADFTK